MPTFVVLAHTQPELVARMVRHLTPYPVVVHVDAKVDIRAFRAALHRCDSVSFVDSERRVNVRWGGFSQVLAMRAAAEQALGLTSAQDHIVVCSGSDYPLRPIRDLAKFLEVSEWRQHIRYFDIAASERKYEDQISRRHYRDLTLINREKGEFVRKLNNAARRALASGARALPRATLPNADAVAFGSQWFAVTRECMEATLKLSSQSVDEFFRRTFSPDEKYFHTLVSQTAHHLETQAGGFEPYVGPGTFRMANLHHLHGSLSKWYTLDDWEELAASDKFFVRKVRLPESASLMDRLDRDRLR